MLTIFKSLVLSRLDYGSQLWSPHLAKHFDQLLKKLLRYFTKHITGMQSLDYSDRLVYLKLHSLQRICERYCIIYMWKIIEGLVPNISNPIICSYSEHREVDLALYHMYIFILADWGHLPLIVPDGEQFAFSMLCLIT